LRFHKGKLKKQLLEKTELYEESPGKPSTEVLSAPQSFIHSFIPHIFLNYLSGIGREEHLLQSAF
jgi:hypothetical protein